MILIKGIYTDLHKGGQEMKAVCITGVMWSDCTVLFDHFNLMDDDRRIRRSMAGMESIKR